MLARRFYSTSVPEIRTVFQARVKEAMKAKNAFVSTTLRSVLAEINASDKAANDTISSSAIVNIIRKASARRLEAASQYMQADRPDLAEKERKEASLLEEFLPPLLSASEIDATVNGILLSLNISPDEDSRKATGKILKAFYTQVDRSLVDPNLVKSRVDHALSG
ncbi:hypothetical protein D9757_004380 [Collybiopsis confluens]|uniref:Altered inheritance of mitochondria protein 41 n=1 Tax=Collybiopsis confluens TaxID=2823264 RepID=A0A8H5HTV0_9AGAR|nr:hypothetical protein D9757_004380 [Collybiopsis confluens]